MKTLFLSFFFSIITVSIYAQITINQSDLMQPGDTFLIHVDINPVLSVDLTPGENLNWDLTGLTSDQSNFACYAPANELEFIDEFEQAQFYTYGPGYIYAGPGGGAPLENWGYMMFFTNENGLFAEGFYSDYGLGYRSTFNSPAELLMFTPATYLDEQTNISYWEVIVDETVEVPVNIDSLYRRDVNKTLNIDAWGSLITDYGTFDVIRVHETGVSVDSIFAYTSVMTVFQQEVAKEVINKYYFWANEVRHPLVTITCDADNNILRIDWMVGAIYTSNKEIVENEISIFPNPAVEMITINCDTQNISIFDSRGTCIKTLNNINSMSKIDVSDLHPGIYFIKMDSSKFVRFVKL